MFYTVLKITSGRWFWRPPLSMHWINQLLVFVMTLTNVSAGILAISSRMLPFKLCFTRKGSETSGVEPVLSVKSSSCKGNNEGHHKVFASQNHRKVQVQRHVCAQNVLRIARLKLSLPQCSQMIWWAEVLQFFVVSYSRFVLT